MSVVTDYRQVPAALDAQVNQPNAVISPQSNDLAVVGLWSGFGLILAALIMAGLSGWGSEIGMLLARG
jgi:hypothetical protein